MIVVLVEVRDQLGAHGADGQRLRHAHRADMRKISLHAANGRAAVFDAVERIVELLRAGAGVDVRVIDAHAVVHHGRELRFFAFEGDRALFEFKHAVRSDVALERVGGVVVNRRVGGGRIAQGGDVVIFNVFVAAVKLAFQSRHVAGGVHLLAQQEGQHLEIMRAGVVERAVEHFAAVDRDMSRPVVARVIIRAAAVAVYDGKAQRPAIAAVENILLERPYVAPVIALIADADEFVRRFFSLEHAVRFLKGEAERLFAQDVAAVCEAEKRHFRVELNRRGDDGQIGRLFSVEGLQIAIDGDIVFRKKRLLFGDVRIGVAYADQIRAGIPVHHFMQVNVAVSHADDQNARSFIHFQNPLFKLWFLRGICAIRAQTTAPVPGAGARGGGGFRHLRFRQRRARRCAARRASR